MGEHDLKTIKEVIDVGRPAYQVIHLCDAGRDGTTSDGLVDRPLQEGVDHGNQ
jgi:hypothetical protein